MVDVLVSSGGPEPWSPQQREIVSLSPQLISGMFSYFSEEKDIQALSRMITHSSAHRNYSFVSSPSCPFTPSNSHHPRQARKSPPRTNKRMSHAHLSMNCSFIKEQMGNTGKAEDMNQPVGLPSNSTAASVMTRSVSGSRIGPGNQQMSEPSALRGYIGAFSSDTKPTYLTQGYENDWKSPPSLSENGGTPSQSSSLDAPDSFVDAHFANQDLLSQCCLSQEKDVFAQSYTSQPMVAEHNNSPPFQDFSVPDYGVYPNFDSNEVSGEQCIYFPTYMPPSWSSQIQSVPQVLQPQAQTTHYNHTTCLAMTNTFESQPSSWPPGFAPVPENMSIQNSPEDGHFPSPFSGTSSASPEASKQEDQSQPTIKQPIRDRNAFLVNCKNKGLSYKDIKRIGGFKEAESTLRGRFRTLTKAKYERVRKPKWEVRDVSSSLSPLPPPPPLLYPFPLCQAGYEARTGISTAVMQIVGANAVLWYRSNCCKRLLRTARIAARDNRLSLRVSQLGRMTFPRYPGRGLHSTLSLMGALIVLGMPLVRRSGVRLMVLRHD